MPRTIKYQAGYFKEKKAVLAKQLKFLRFVDTCFVAIMFCVLAAMPVNAKAAPPSVVKTTVSQTSATSNINIFAAHVTDELQASCNTSTFLTCEFNVVSQKKLLHSLIAVDTSGEISESLKDNDYQVLIGSAMLTSMENNHSKHELVLEVSTQWRGISIDEAKLSLIIDGTEIEGAINHLSKHLLAQWTKSVSTKGLFGAEYLYQSLGASDYQKELKVPNQIGDFALFRQHLYKDPMKGMLSRYIHKDYKLAVFDIYVYPLKTNESIAVESQSELLYEQQDIRTISQSFGENALSMTDIYELKGINGTQVFAFEASLQTDSDPLFATQYIFVKNDKVVKFSVNVPARITDILIAQAIEAIQVPGASSLMQQVRVPIDATTSHALEIKVAP